MGVWGNLLCSFYSMETQTIRRGCEAMMFPSFALQVFSCLTEATIGSTTWSRRLIFAASVLAILSALHKAMIWHEATTPRPCFNIRGLTDLALDEN